MFSNPKHNIDQLGLSDGGIVADFGSGSGHYSIEAARAVAPTGKVFAIDVQKDLLEKLKKEAQRSHLRNLDVMSGDLEKLGGSGLRESSCDCVLASNILFMIVDKRAFVQEAKRVLKTGGRMLVVDWSGSFSGMGPHADHVMYKDDCVKIITEQGLEFEREIHAGDHHYGIIFRKQ